MINSFTVQTNQHSQLVDITLQIQEVIDQTQVNEGICVVFIPHTTAAVTINENADPTVKGDILTKLENLIPWNDNYKHLEGNSAAHLKASLVGSSEQIIIENGKLELGTWQGIYLAEFDGPRTRKVQVKLVGS
ncbi:secondary thiamine-phosphate synthase enzyme [Halobacteroides halobius DSM 5150]|uniref:Secondary thiamine-phosphate synthase enzyme n=1 Tax=Halobacteroides halobius (strain ATCC 35273 / DSM 5150 / MD-1) TaxID=748449 RepID=L0K8D1_HALHC|nr:secondary thiamine-phosphate synthase enzyme YjbQ [Halobacteroides halobius]AGB40373.1 secondary thiamine-phosphate synthase enzyme [Halobacteroides halobius DSM 5150]